MVRTRYTLESHKDKVIGLLLEGTPGREVARQYSVTEGAVRNFRRRHAEVLIPAKEALVEAAVTYAITVETERLAAKNERWLGGRQVIADRAADPEMQAIPGGKTGLLVHQIKAVGTGQNMQIIDEYVVDTGLMAELNKLENDVSTQLGQSREKTASINIDNRTQVLIRQVTGAEVPLG